MRPLLLDDVRTLLAALDFSRWPTGLTAARDGFVLLAGFADTLRRSELAALTIADLTWHPADGLHLRMIWTEASSGADVFARLNRLPGFGKQKAQIAADSDVLRSVRRRVGVLRRGFRGCRRRSGPAPREIPAPWRTDVLVTIDGAGAGHDIINHLTAMNTAVAHGKRGRRVEYSIGWPVDERTLGAIGALHGGDSGTALDTDGVADPGAQVADLTGAQLRLQPRDLGVQPVAGRLGAARRGAARRRRRGRRGPGRGRRPVGNRDRDTRDDQQSRPRRQHHPGAQPAAAPARRRRAAGRGRRFVFRGHGTVPGLEPARRGERASWPAAAGRADARDPGEVVAVELEPGALELGPVEPGPSRPGVPDRVGGLGAVGAGRGISWAKTTMLSR